MEFLAEASLSGPTPILDAARAIIAAQILSLMGSGDKSLRTVISNGGSYISY